ncbi:aspartate 4-decarboxylase [Pseudoflavitalea sp. G-6-1-2]|uniref:aspartate 4-decarboxylase n=1 Tax=Pseudoflavitalea sp. G-6-1-2 TaxID=2728841 RepID=UPI00146A6B9B|nr:aspartate 4-decarboxylase [Pseudoflavitalea sp. G-6-1-2]NML23137.1 aspartate 4-decarboxylase [Pseudoflavitalea sp. G-6-1-2]
MSSTIAKIKTTRRQEKKLEQLSPFELKNTLISLAKDEAETGSFIMLNAGRGNPNWIATTPREAFFTLGLFGLQECRRVADISGGMAGIPEKKGIAKRFEKFLNSNKKAPGIDLLKGMYRYGIRQHKFNADAWVHELAEGVIGDQYPVPDRMLSHMEVIVGDYIVQEMFDRSEPKVPFNLFAVEGGTAAMCYIFDSLQQNFLVKKGDSIALMVPTFTPYIEIPQLDRFEFNVINIEASSMNKDGRHTWQYPDEELEKLKDPAVKVLFVVNPSNPPSVAIHPGSLSKIVKIIKNHNPNLIVVTDDVYGTFVPEFRSLMAVIPDNTICVYSFSKYFGCTGWRLGVVAISEKNIFDKGIAALPDHEKAKLAIRYGTLSLQPEKISFIDRMVADSRDVALNHTAGLSLPQQTQMLLFSAFCLLDKKDKYKKLTQDLCRKRMQLLWKELEIPLVSDPMSASYYSEIDIKVWAHKVYGDAFTKWLTTHFEPVDILFRLAEKTGVVLLNGGGFDGPEWSIRVSLANLPTESYPVIGKAITQIMREYVNAWKGK